MEWGLFLDSEETIHSAEFYFFEKRLFSSFANSQYVSMKISWIGPWVSRILCTKCSSFFALRFLYILGCSGQKSLYSGPLNGSVQQDCGAKRAWWRCKPFGNRVYIIRTASSKLLSVQDFLIKLGITLLMHLK